MTQLAQILAGTQIADQQQRQNAENSLKQAQTQPGFAVTILKLMSVNTVDLAIRQAGAIAFKNFVKKAFSPDELAINVTQEERNGVKQHIVNLMCTTPGPVMAQLSEALRIIAAIDFPKDWPTLLPEIISKLQQNMNNMSVINGMLETANSIFKRFRYVRKTDGVLLDLLAVLKQFQVPMLQLFGHLANVVGQLAGQPNTNEAVLQQHLKALRTLARIFYSLNYQDLPEYFEDHIQEWMGFHIKFLTFSSAAIDAKAIEFESTQVEKLQSALIENVALYAEKYEEEFQPFMEKFTSGIWALLTNLKPVARYDIVINSAMKFLTSVVKKPWHKQLFQDENTQRAICEKIVVQNVMLRETDEEDFEDNPIEYIRRDIEGADADSRRRSACDLVQGLCVNYEKSVTGICGNYVNILLGEYGKNPSQEWKKKDAAITLVLALSAKGTTRAHGATTTNALINVVDFIGTQVLPELQSGPNDGAAILKADAIKFASMFRQQLPDDALNVVLPLIINHLQAKSYVVHTYAAAWLERVLAMKRPDNKSLYRVNPQMIQQNLETMLSSLFQIITRNDYPENEYLMKCVMRVIVSAGHAGVDISNSTQQCITVLAQILVRVSANPSNPQYNHYLFESLSALVKFVGGKNTSANVVNTFESLLFPPFMDILKKEIEDFMPYVFQILAQLLELRQNGMGLSNGYKELFQPLLNPGLWMSRGNVPALVRILVAYLKVAPQVCIAKLSPLLGCWQSAFSTRSTESSSFDLLGVIVTCLPLQSIQQFLPHIFNLLLTALQDPKRNTINYKRGFLTFLSYFIAKHGYEGPATIMNGMQNNLFWQIIVNVWTPNVEHLGNKKETKKGALLASARLLQANELNGNPQFFIPFVAATALLLKSNLNSGNVAGNQEDETPAVYSAAHVKLRFGAETYDAFKDVQDCTSPVAQAVTNAWNGKICNTQFLPHYQQLDVVPANQKVKKKDKDEKKKALKEYLRSININTQGM